MKKKKWSKKLAILLTVILCLCETGGYVKAADQEEAPVLTTIENTSEDTAKKLAQSLLGADLKVESAKFIGNATQFGSFTGAYNTVGFNEGIVLSSGLVKPNEKSMFEQGYKEMASATIKPGAINKTSDKLDGFTIDPLGSDYYDIAILEFTVTPNSDSLSFQYAVASDEYIHYIKNFWDQFVLTVNGVNYAWIPQNKDDTSQPVPVTIGTVNNKMNSEYYRGNVKDILDGETDDENAISLNHFIFNGITKVFSVNAPVNKGEKNVIRLAIADYKDSVLDSAVFVKAGSVQDKQALYGLIDIAYVDSEQKDIYVRRKGGYNSAVSADIVYTDENGIEVGREKIEFPDGAYINITKAPENAVYAHLDKPTGSVEVVKAKVDVDNWVSATALKAMKTKVTGTIYESKDGKNVPAANAKVSYKTTSQETSKTTKTDKNGKYTLYDISGGKGNIFVTNADGTKETVADTEITIYDIAKTGKQAEDIILTKKVSMTVENSNNNASLPVVIANLDKASNSNNVKATVSAKDVENSSNKEIIEKGIQKTGTVSLDYVLDISINADGNKQTKLDNPITVTVQIPKELKGKSDYFLYHVHNKGTEVEILYDLDNDPDTITVQIDKLSEFALLTADDAKSGKFENNESKSLEEKLATEEKDAVNEANKIVEKLKDPSTETPSKPTTPENPSTPETPSKPTTPENPGTPETPSKPTTPESPSSPETPNTPSVPDSGNQNSNNSSSSNEWNGNNNVIVTEPLRQKIFEGVMVTNKKVLYKGDNDVIEVNGVNESNIVVEYTSKDSKVVTVDKDGNIAAKTAGSTKIITEITKEGVAKKFETEVKVNKPCIKISNGKAKVKKGKTTTFKANVYGSDAKVKWSVSNKKVASIDSKTGKLKAKKVGTVTVYAKAGSLKQSYKVKVVK